MMSGYFRICLGFLAVKLYLDHLGFDGDGTKALSRGALAGGWRDLPFRCLDEAWLPRDMDIMDREFQWESMKIHWFHMISLGKSWKITENHWASFLSICVQLGIQVKTQWKPRNFPILTDRPVVCAAKIDRAAEGICCSPEALWSISETKHRYEGPHQRRKFHQYREVKWGQAPIEAPKIEDTVQSCWGIIAYLVTSLFFFTCDQDLTQSALIFGGYLQNCLCHHQLIYVDLLESVLGHWFSGPHCSS